MKKLIFSWLLHHANRYYKSEHFYTIKAKILEKYGKVVDYHYQYIKGKRCHTCGGSGIWLGYSWYNNRQYTDICNNCGGNGWYRNPHWNVLAVIKMGKFTFHKPLDRSYTKPAVGSPVIEGYVEHEPSRYSYAARMILFMLYDWKGHGTNWKFGIGHSWYGYKQWRPAHIFNNAVHLIRKREQSIPFQQWRRKMMMAEKMRERKLSMEITACGESGWDDDLPF
jgi:hypothetical protein